MQLQAASASATLTAGRRFLFSATLYVVSGVVALACSAVLLEAIGILGGAFGLLAGAVVLGAGHALYLRRFGIRLRLQPRWLRERELWRLALALLAGASIGMALQINLAISLAAISSHAGAITAYSYAYFMATVILTISSLPLGAGDIARSRQPARAGGQGRRRAALPARGAIRARGGGAAAVRLRGRRPAAAGRDLRRLAVGFHDRPAVRHRPLALRHDRAGGPDGAGRDGVAGARALAPVPAGRAGRESRSTRQS